VRRGWVFQGFVRGWRGLRWGGCHDSGSMMSRGCHHRGTGMGYGTQPLWYRYGVWDPASLVPVWVMGPSLFGTGMGYGTQPLWAKFVAFKKLKSISKERHVIYRFISSHRYRLGGYVRERRPPSRIEQNAKWCCQDNSQYCVWRLPPSLSSSGPVAHQSHAN
jgi:hypothetical protein